MGIVKIFKKFGLILSGHQKIRILELSIMMVIGGILETMSVSLIMPFMNVVMVPEETMEKWYAIILCKIFGIESHREFLVFLAIVLACVYIFKNVYLMLQYYLNYKFVYNNMFALQKRLLNAFLKRPYEYFLKVNSGEIIRVISGDTSSAFNILITFLQMFTEIAVSTMLIVAIFIITPAITLFIATILIVLMVFIYIILKPVLRQAGVNLQRAGSGMNQWMLQSIEGIKELKVMHKEEYFQKNYNDYGQIYVRSLRWNGTLSVAPRFMIEGICMGAMFIVVAYLINSGVVLESVIPTLTAVAMAAVRLLPSVNRISTALNTLAYGEPMLDKVIENLNILEGKDRSGKAGDGIPKTLKKVKDFSWKIDFHNITYHYPDVEENVLTDASMTIHKGELVGIVGPSGAGKTTSVDIILGLLNPQSGQVLVDGIDIKSDLESWLSQIGYIPQMIFMLDDSILANVAFGDQEVDENRVWMSLKEASLDEFVKALPEGLDTEIGERGVRLSGGQRQRIGIARALYRNPGILIFDEATSALDNGTESAIMDSINELHGTKTMIIIAHRLTTIEACDHIYRVENGKFVAER